MAGFHEGAHHVIKLYKMWLDHEDLADTDDSVLRFAEVETKDGSTQWGYDREGIVRVLRERV